MVDRRLLEVPRTARIFVRSDAGSPARDVWFLLHGYGQLAGPFLSSLEALARPGRTLVAPEALSRFYLRRGTGSVGASWMTREERADEIRDTLRYLDRVWAEVRAGLAAPPESLTVFGFSQGGAAAARWAVLGDAPLARLVSWGCPLPPDLDLAAHSARVKALRWTFVLGDEDLSIDREAHAAGLVRLAELGVEAERLRYPGGHEMDDRLLALVGE